MLLVLARSLKVDIVDLNPTLEPTTTGWTSQWQEIDGLTEADPILIKSFMDLADSGFKELG
ncbi:MAG: hypothetical protein MI861_20535, partial [Pirellulales bacterium]|nr:hypothetical protein [Pirellulales bacterium]